MSRPVLGDRRGGHHAAPREPPQELAEGSARQGERIDAEHPFDVGDDGLHHLDAAFAGARPPDGALAVGVDGADEAGRRFRLRYRLHHRLGARADFLDLDALLLEPLQLALRFLRHRLGSDGRDLREQVRFVSFARGMDERESERFR